MDGIGGYHVKGSIPSLDKSLIFSLICGKRDSKEKYIHKTKHDHIQNYMQNMFIIVELTYGTWGRRKRQRER
jgi:hypothetical protein